MTLEHALERPRLLQLAGQSLNVGRLIFAANVCHHGPQ